MHVRSQCFIVLEFKIEVSEDILSGVENQWNIFVGHWGEHYGHTYDLCWRVSVCYRISVEIMMNTNTDVEAPTDEFEGCDEELFFKLQNDFKTDWAPKLNTLHAERPIVVQLNLHEFGSGPHLTKDNVSFDVYYHGTKIQNNCSVLEEIMYNVNRNRRKYIHIGRSIHIHAITSNLI
ncbi:hypothetical protein PHET_09722 [Paragonimus heterotremus]|uniref:Uncharacterized protein n=1 Tax=Paragonimus heterotremus TaxID=100268 RepID=A0A8J4TAB8_9TREM|nr:hypothetical protein PHET_09722 [Paragonimus heterotremus]